MSFNHIKSRLGAFAGRLCSDFGAQPGDMVKRHGQMRRIDCYLISIPSV